MECPATCSPPISPFRDPILFNPPVCLLRIGRVPQVIGTAEVAWRLQLPNQTDGDPLMLPDICPLPDDGPSAAKG